MRCESGNDGHGRDAGRGGIAGELEHVTDRAALHAGVGTPRAVGILVAAAPAVVGRVGVDDHAGSAVLLRHEDFHAAEILAVAHQHDLAADVDFQLVELVEVIRGAIVGVDDVGFDIAGGRHAVEGHDHARIVLVGIVVDVLARRAVHFDACGCGQVDADLGGIVDPDFVFDDFGIEPGVAEFLGDVVGGRFVLDRARHVRSFGEYAQMFFGELGDRGRRGNALRWRILLRRRGNRRWVRSRVGLRNSWMMRAAT